MSSRNFSRVIVTLGGMIFALFDVIVMLYTIFASTFFVTADIVYVMFKKSNSE